MDQRLFRTLVFVGAAVVCLGGAVATSIVTRPAKLDDTLLVGQEFYPEFKDPTKATALRVAAYDKADARVKVFNVEFRNGLWRIPSHHDYPADGEEQLAKTAASVVGIERGLYAGKTTADHKRLGVLDPLDESITGTEGRGSRITLFQGDKPLVDLIVGNKVEEGEDVYYVRRADENRVYRAQLANLKISTKFADWIEPDLLQLDRNKLVEMVVDKYHVDEEAGSIVQEELNVLKKNSSGTWQLEGINADTEKVKTATVNSMTYALDDLKIVGVRPKPAGLVKILKGESDAGLNQLELLRMQQAGYFLTGRGELVSNEGEIVAGTNEGVRYTLRFGEVISGSDLEIEVGSPVEESAEGKKEGADGDAKSEDASDADSDAASQAGDESEQDKEKASEDKSNDNEDDSKSDSDLKKNRYVFITVSFDEKLLGEPPQPPVEPQPPAEPAESDAQTDSDKAQEGEAQTEADAAAPENAADAESKSETPAGESEAEQSAEEKSADEPAQTEPAQEQSADSADNADAADKPAESSADKPAESSADKPAESSADKPAESSADKPAEKPDPQKEYEEAKKKYDTELAAYEQKKRDYDKKVEDGKKRAQELNERFAAWYYVISADLFDKLHVSRSDLVEPQAPKENAATDSATGDTKSPSESESSPADSKPTADESDAKQPEPADKPQESAGEPQSESTQTPPSSKGEKPASPASGEGEKPSSPADEAAASEPSPPQESDDAAQPAPESGSSDAADGSSTPQ